MAVRDFRKVQFICIFSTHKNTKKSQTYFNLSIIKQNSIHSHPSNTVKPRKQEHSKNKNVQTDFVEKGTQR